MYVGFHVKYPILLSDFTENWIMSTDFRKYTQISNFMKILPVGAQLFHEDGRTDRLTEVTKLIVTFGNSTYAPD